MNGSLGEITPIMLRKNLLHFEQGKEALWRGDN